MLIFFHTWAIPSIVMDSRGFPINFHWFSGISHQFSWIPGIYYQFLLIPMDFISIFMDFLRISLWFSRMFMDFRLITFIYSEPLTMNTYSAWWILKPKGIALIYLIQLLMQPLPKKIVIIIWSKRMSSCSLKIIWWCHYYWYVKHYGTAIFNKIIFFKPENLFYLSW